MRTARRRIVFGLAAVRNVGESLVGAHRRRARGDGPFTDFYDFCRRVDPVVLNKRTMESLVKAGAFDSLGHPRQGLCLVFEEIVDRTLERRREERGRHLHAVLVARGLGRAGRRGTGGFGEARRVPIPDTEFAKTQRLAFEKEMLGLYVSDHPLRGFEAALRRHTDCTIAELKELDDGPADGPRPRGHRSGTVGGVVTELVRRYTKRGELMATFVLEDLRGLDRGLRVPQGHARVSGRCSRTTPIVSSGAGSTPATTR